jgi:urease accessory protein
MNFSGPLRVQRLFYPEKERADQASLPCHCYLLHPPGGMVSGDSLDIKCRLQAGSHCLVTTPAAGKIYRAGEGWAAQSQSCCAELEDGVLEWLPLENIVYNGAQARLSTLFRLRGQSRLLAWDLTCLGRAACDEKFAAGRLVQSLCILRDEKPLLHERLDLEGGGEGGANPALLRGGQVLAAFYACGRPDHPRDAKALRSAKEALQGLCARTREESGGQESCGVTLRGEVLIARCLGANANVARRFCRKAWGLTRPLLLGIEACAPRVWHT